MSDLQSPESTRSQERMRQEDDYFRNICLSSVVGNYGNGKEQSDIEGNDNLFNITNNTIDQKYSQGIDSLFNKYPDNTKVLFLPMRSMSYEMIDSLQLPDSDNVNPQKEYVMLIEFNGYTHAKEDPREKADNRHGKFGAIAVISEEMADLIAENIPDNPEVIYEFMQAINGEKGGHIRANDNTPMTMNLGNGRLVVISNDRFSGNIKRDIQSVPLDKDFEPNPLDGFRD